jgi:hypothetical protein
MRRLASALFALATIAAPLSAQTHTDFSGKWALDPKSVDAAMGVNSMTLSVAQDAKTITIETAASTQMGDQKTTTVLNVDGSMSKNSVPTPNGALELTSTPAWDGAALVVTTKGDFQGQSVMFTERWSLEDGGKTLRLQRDITAMGQSASLKLAFTKQ